MEHVIVKYPKERPVYIDGKQNGKTNEILRIGTGIHVFDLGEPKDYTPDEIEITVADTSSIEPLEIEFKEK